MAIEVAEAEKKKPEEIKQQCLFVLFAVVSWKKMMTGRTGEIQAALWMLPLLQE